MAGKRKRTRRDTEGDQKRQRIAGNLDGKDPMVKQALLSQFYPQVLSLREYLLSRLPLTSKMRRKKILKVGQEHGQEKGVSQLALATFMDQTLIGVLKDEEGTREERMQQWTSFSQKADISETTFANTSGVGSVSQSEIVDFAIWMLCSKINSSNERVKHLLAQGYRKNISSRAVNRDENVGSAIPGVISTYPNSHVTAMKTSPWPEILGMMGRQGEIFMVDLILGCGIFLSLSSGRGSYRQLSGEPLGDLTALKASAQFLSHGKVKAVSRSPVNSDTVHSRASIAFVRNRMLYARAGLDAHGRVRFGLRHIHVLNRFPYRPEVSASKDATAHVMMYMFPRQFGLHNVFTAAVDSKETVQPFKDYTLREDEILAKFSPGHVAKVPKRLRGNAFELVLRLQKRHSRCPYKILLEHYCSANHDPSSRLIPSTQLQLTASTILETQRSQSTDFDSPSTAVNSAAVPRNPSMMDCATPSSMVSAFCRAVFFAILPPEFWGTGEIQKHNSKIFYRNLDSFIQLRRYETLSLHEVSQGLKMAGIAWLGRPESAGHKLAQSDFNKRQEIFHEFLYYLFDSLLIPLIRANFHVTESNIHRYRLFFFRHDVWKSLAEPAITSLKTTMFEEIKLHRAQKILDSRKLGFSQIRLLPKQTGVRPILNLKRRPVVKGSKYLGSSINSILAPVYNALTLEKTLDSSRLGSTLFSVGDLYTKLRAFKAHLSTTKSSSKPLYFAKVDVQSAFDTIPQSAVINVISSIPTESEYRISRHVELKPGEGWRSSNSTSAPKPMRKWIALAKSASDFQTFDEDLEASLGVGRKNTIFVENVVNQFRDTEELLSLLIQHVKQNMVKIGKKFYRQKEGIPQGSVLSSLLCNYFYADLEARHLGFLNGKSGCSLLLRLVDDFLLITTEREHVRRFLDVMHEGVSEYGVRVNPDKTLVNFEVQVKGKKISRLVGTRNFPYCGSFIDTKRLDITRDRERRKDMAIEDSLTVELSRNIGKTFHRKVLNTFKLQAHAMYLDTTHNSLRTVITNIHSAFLETAMKMYAYNRCLPLVKQPCAGLIIRIIKDTTALAYSLTQSKSRNSKGKANGYKCAIRKSQVEYLALNAFRQVLGRRQSKFTGVVAWLNGEIGELRMRLRLGGEGMGRMEGVMMSATD